MLAPCSISVTFIDGQIRAVNCCAQILPVLVARASYSYPLVFACTGKYSLRCFYRIAIALPHGLSSSESERHEGFSGQAYCRLPLRHVDPLSFSSAPTVFQCRQNCD